MHKTRWTRRSFLKASAAATVGISGCASGILDKSTANKPVNVLFIAADDLNTDIGWGGSGKKERHANESLTHEHICLLSEAVSMQDKRRYANSLAAMIVGDYTGSRFYWALVDNALADTAAMQYESMDGAGAVYSYIRCSSENKDKVMEIVAEIFDDIQRDGVSESELRTARNKVLSAVTIKSETPMGRLVNLGFNWVYRNEYRDINEDIAAIKAVKTGDINALMREFKLSRFTQLSIGPE